MKTPSKKDIDILILTPIPIEYQSIRSYLRNIQTVEKEGLYYEVGHFKGLHHPYSIAVREIGANNTSSSVATEKAINHLQPSIVILFGIAGGIKDVKIGDIVIGQCSYDYETGKETDEGSVARPQGTNYDSKLIEFARHVNRQGKWRKKLSSQHYPSVFFGAIASGNKVVSSTNSPVFKYIKTHLNDSLCLEMEASGFGKVVDQNRDRLRPFLIRGISDLIDDKSTTDGEGGQELAVQNAAAFLFGFLKELDFLNYKMIVMNTKELTQAVVSTLFPLLKLDSIKEIGHEFKEATDTSVRELWEKVRPIFIEEIEDISDAEFKKEDTIQEVRGAIKSSLKKVVQKDDELLEELKHLIAKVEKQAQQSHITVSNSTNPVINSSLSAGRDINVGNRIQSNTTQTHHGSGDNIAGNKIITS